MQRKNKHNRELIDQILDKARLRKGLSHREAAVLLDCDLEDKNQRDLCPGRADQEGFLWKPYRAFCAVISV